MDPASPQRDDLLRAPTLDLTLPEALDEGRQEEDSKGGEEGEDLTLPEVLDGRRQEEDSEDESKVFKFKVPYIKSMLNILIQIFLWSTRYL